MLYGAFMEVSIKALADEGVIEGYASTFGNTDLQGDVMEQGAFSKTLKHHKGVVPILMAHRTDQPIGWGIEATEDSKGLKIRGELTLDSPVAKAAHASILHGLKLGKKPGLSIGYFPHKNGASYDEDAGVRRLKSVELLEYSLALVPANQQAGITRAKDLADIRSVENYLKFLGLSGDEARTIISICKGTAERDATLVLPEPERDAKELENERASAAFNARVRLTLFDFQLRSLQ